MYISATFRMDGDVVSRLIDTDKLEDSLKKEIERAATNGVDRFVGARYYDGIQEGAIKDGKVFPVTIHAIIDVYWE